MGLAPVGEPAGQLVGQPEMGLDQQVPQPRVTGGGELDEAGPVASWCDRTAPSAIGARHAACTGARRAGRRGLRTVLVHERVQDRAPTGRRRRRRPAPSVARAARCRRSGTRRRCSPGSADMARSRRPVRRPWRTSEAQLVDGEPEVLDLLDVESRPRRHGRDREADEHEQVVLDGERQLHGTARGGGAGRSSRLPRDQDPRSRRSRARPQLPSAGSSAGWMVNSSIRPVISKTFRIRGSATTTRSSRPTSTHRLRAPMSTPSPVESMKVTPDRSTTTVPGPPSTAPSSALPKGGRRGHVHLAPHPHHRDPVPAFLSHFELQVHTPSSRRPCNRRPSPSPSAGNQTQRPVGSGIPATAPSGAKVLQPAPIGSGREG